VIGAGVFVAPHGVVEGDKNSPWPLSRSVLAPFGARR